MADTRRLMERYFSAFKDGRMKPETAEGEYRGIEGPP